jgi:hypothetical protein
VKAKLIVIAFLTVLAPRFLPAEALPAPGGALPLGLSAQPAAATSTNPIPAEAGTVAFTFSGPASRDFALTAPTSTWFGLGELSWSLVLSDKAPTNVQVLVFMKDWDYLWYQQLIPGYAVPGVTNRYHLDLSPSASAWEPRGHHAAWNARALMEPREFGIRVFVDGAGAVTGALENVVATWQPADTTPPTIRDIRPSTRQLACYEKFEVTFELPDRYANPFDPEEISVTATIKTPDGQTVTIDGFHSRSYYRITTPTGEETLPQGPPHWKIRYAPTKPGTYQYTLHARDTSGTATWGPGAFTARPPAQPGYVRVSQADRRFFEFDNGAYFFPIGHNIRSPSDDRMDAQFPWAKRWVEGSTAYVRHFSTMREYGENMAEVWMAAWSLGLEWSPQWRGYHGVGQYNLMHAWEMDRVMDEADRNGLYLNIVIHNHGKFSGHSDSEWAGNPFNKKLGGFLEKPDDYFSDPRAVKAFKQLMRYTVARWGYSTRVFAWELWSELNLSGSNDKLYRTPECVNWHRQATAFIHELDPNHHLITTHYSGDFNSQNMEITALPGITHASVDAYHGDPRVLHIVDLLSATAQFNNPAGKPVMVTEFGGNWNAQGLAHLESSLHAGLWASTCIAIAGTPFFWWWGLIEEENYYSEFLAISRFMKGEDRRDPNLLASLPVLSIADAPADQIQARALKSETRALGWIYDTRAFNTTDSEAHPTLSNVVARLDGMSNGLYRVEFWTTTTGKPAKQEDVAVKEGSLSVTVPPFARDIAFKVRKR